MYDIFINVNKIRAYIVIILNSIQFKTRIFILASLLSQSVTDYHLLLFSNIKLPFPPSSKLTEHILVPFNLQNLLNSYMIFELHPLRILIQTLLSIYLIVSLIYLLGFFLQCLRFFYLNILFRFLLGICRQGFLLYHICFT